ncbi:MAG TPA: class D sortase [Bryobacteraceae bacterium]|jgi:sortase A|nr:class D sortase [Bryobacteraceae bacterium]
MRAHRTRRIFSYLLMSGGALLLFLGGREVVESRLGQMQAAREFQAPDPPRPSPFNAQSQVPSQTSRAPRVAQPALGQAIAKLSIPRLHTNLYVVEGDGEGQLRLGPGHVKGTVMPGADGNCIIAGHRDTHFRALKDIQTGDEIKLQTREGEYTYRVQNMEIVSADNTSPLRPTADAELHLVTCYPFYYVGSAPKRFIVEAHLEDSAHTVTPVSFPHPSGGSLHSSTAIRHGSAVTANTPRRTSPSTHVRRSRKMY